MKKLFMGLLAFCISISLPINAFAANTSPSSLIVPSNMPIAPANATFNVGGLYYLITSNNTVALTGYSSNPFNVTVPQTVTRNNVRYTVTQIWGWAFNNSPTLSSIVLPSTITSIGERAFLGCINLTSVDMSSATNLTDIGWGAFGSCTRLSSLTLPPNITIIGDFAFAECSALRFVEIPSGVTSISQGAFYNCRQLEQLVVPASVISIAGGSVTGPPPFQGTSLVAVFGIRGSYAEQYFNLHFPGTFRPM